MKFFIALLFLMSSAYAEHPPQMEFDENHPAPLIHIPKIKQEQQAPAPKKPRLNKSKRRAH
jgi:hypothetical protein